MTFCHWRQFSSFLSLATILVAYSRVLYH